MENQNSLAHETAKSFRHYHYMYTESKNEWKSCDIDAIVILLWQLRVYLSAIAAVVSVASVVESVSVFYYFLFFLLSLWWCSRFCLFCFSHHFPLTAYKNKGLTHWHELFFFLIRSLARYAICMPSFVTVFILICFCFCHIFHRSLFFPLSSSVSPLVAFFFLFVNFARFQCSAICCDACIECAWIGNVDIAVFIMRKKIE